MVNAESYDQRRAATHTLLRGTSFVLIVLMPFSVFFPVGFPAGQNVLTLYAQRGFYLTDIPLALLLILTLIGQLHWRRGPWPVTVSLLGICVLAFMSISQAVAPSFAFYSAVRIILALYLYLWFLQPVLPTSHVAAALSLTLAVHAVVGVMQVVNQGPLNLPGELALPPAASGAAVTLLDGLRYLRAYGLTFHPNVLGGFLAVTILLVVPLLRRWLMLPLWWLLWGGLLLTFSRSAWLALALILPVALVVCFLKLPEIRTKLTIAGAGIVIILFAFLLLAGEQVTSRLGPLAKLLAKDYTPALTEKLPRNEEEFSLTERAALNDLAWEIISARPFNGVGAGNFALAIPHLRPTMRAQAVHNVPLLLAAELGVLGGILWLVIGLAATARFILHARKGSPWLLCAICAFLALLIISFFDSYPWSLNSGLLLTAMVLGLASRTVGSSS